MTPMCSPTKRIALVLSLLVPACGVPAGDEEIRSTTAAVVTTSHPRLWVTQGDLPRLQSWASPQNPMWQNAFLPALNQAITTYNNQFFPNGQPNPNYPDDGSANWLRYPSEAYAEIFAFASLVDPNPANRPIHAQRARNLIMNALGQAALGPDLSNPPAPFRAPQFALYNRANYWGEAFPLVVDWIYPYLTAQDKATIQKAFLVWESQCLTASTTGGDHPTPVGVTNSRQLFPGGRPYRMAANNYYIGHMRALTLMALALDPSDDPPVNPNQPPTQLGNTVGSYLPDATGAWLYQVYSMFEDPAVSAPNLGVPAAGLGLASGGLPAEGMLYGHSLGYLHQTLLALHTAGYDDPALSGPQAGLVTSAYWDRVLSGFQNEISPASHIDPNQQYLGPLWDMASYGDLLRFWITTDWIEMFGSIGALDQNSGRTDRLNALRWLSTNVLEGGATKLYSRAGQIWGNAYASDAIFYFLLFDPAAAPASDPRPALPTSFVDPKLGRLLARTDWTPNATTFDFLCPWISINHQLGDGNQFELYRKGEWLTKERSNYTNDWVGATPDYHNTLALQNNVPQNLQSFELQISQRGGQWMIGANAGDPTVAISTGAGYAFAEGNSTNLYNRPNQWTPANTALDILHASRSILWMEPDRVVVYDRATSATANRFKRFNLTFAGYPGPVTAGQLTVTTPKGQSLFVTSLLPANASLVAGPVENFSAPAAGDPTTTRLVVQDPTNPSTVRFLHVLQGADPGAPADAAPTLVQSSSGTPYDGAVVNGVAVLFKHDLTTVFGGTTFSVPAAVDGFVVSGLAPGSACDTTITPDNQGNNVVALAPGTTYVADGAGVVVFGATLPLGVTPTSDSYQVAGGAGTVTVSTMGAAAWTATSNAAWLSVTSGASATGSGTVQYAVAANGSTAPRTGTLTVAGNTVTVQQAGAPCAFQVTPAAINAPAAASSATVSVSTTGGCAWSATSSTGFITVAAGASGSGSGTVTLNLAQNAGVFRSATVTVAGKAVAVNQSGSSSPACTYTVNAAGGSFPPCPFTSQFGVTSQGGCAWTATTSAPWITLVQYSGVGNGTASFQSQSNPTNASRTATIAVGGQSYTVVQGAGPYTPGG